MNTVILNKEKLDDLMRKQTESYWRSRISKEVLAYFAHKDRPMDCVKQITEGTDNCNFVEEVAEFIIVSGVAR